jgi:hypothetical protein
MRIGFEGQDLKLKGDLFAGIRSLFGEDPSLSFEESILTGDEGSSGSFDLVFVLDDAKTDWEKIRESRGRSVLVSLALSAQELPVGYIAGSSDELLVLPLRPADVFALFRRVKLHETLQELAGTQSRLAASLERLESDVALAERLQRAVLPTRFPEMRGLKVRHRYLAGMRGGDWFDIAEARDGSVIHLVLSDGSSSGLSSGVGAALTRVAMKVSLESARSPVETVRALHEELQEIFTEKHRLSLIYGVLSRSDLRFRWLALGNARIFFRSALTGDFVPLPYQGDLLCKGVPFPEDVQCGEVQLSPQDQVVLVSDGFLDGCGGLDETLRVLNGKSDSSGGRSASGRDAESVLSELAWIIRRGLADDELPAQECSALWLEIDSRVIRLAR